MTDVFNDGQTGSLSAVKAAFLALQSQGQGILDNIEASKTDILLTIEQGLSALNGRQQRALRLKTPNILGRFPVSDLLGIDQANTTATVRIDAQAVSLKERRKPIESSVRYIKFSASSGVVDQSGDVYRVFTDDNSVPTGVFLLELEKQSIPNLIVFDTVSMPSEPSIVVEITNDGVNWTEATSVSKSGYRVTAWLPQILSRTVRVRITPSHPDTLGGSTYSFGITGVAAQTVDFHLRSELYFHPITVQPSTPFIRLRADDSSLLQYFMSFDNTSYFEVRPGTLISVPGTSGVNAAEVELDGEGVMGHSVQAGIYLPTLKVIDEAGARLNFVPNMLVNQSPIQSCVTISGTELLLLPFDEALHPGQQFTVSYFTGPSDLTVWLRVRLSAMDGQPVPVFHGAHIESV